MLTETQPRRYSQDSQREHALNFPVAPQFNPTGVNPLPILSSLMSKVGMAAPLLSASTREED